MLGSPAKTCLAIGLTICLVLAIYRQKQSHTNPFSNIGQQYLSASKAKPKQQIHTASAKKKPGHHSSQSPTFKAQKPKPSSINSDNDQTCLCPSLENGQSSTTPTEGNLPSNFACPAQADIAKPHRSKPSAAVPILRQATMYLTEMAEHPEYSEGKPARRAYDRAFKTFEDYGEKWGYPTHRLRWPLVGGDKNLGHLDEKGIFLFSKLLYLITLISEELAKPEGQRSEWVLFFDIDIVLLNHNIPFEIFLPSEGFADIQLLASSDFGGGFQCGIWFMRVSAWSLNVLTEASAVRLLRPEVDLPYPECDAMLWVMNKKDYKDQVVYQPQNWWNAYEKEGHFYPGIMQLHMAGYGENDKSEPMTKLLDRVDQGDSEFNVPVSDLNLREDIDEFWSTFDAARTLLKETDAFIEETKVRSFDHLLATDVIESTMALKEKVRRRMYMLDVVKEHMKKLSMARSRWQSHTQHQETGESENAT